MHAAGDVRGVERVDLLGMDFEQSFGRLGEDLHLAGNGWKWF